MLRIGCFSDTSPRVGYLARYRRVRRRQPSTSQEVSASEARRGIQPDTFRYLGRYQVSSGQRVHAMRVAAPPVLGRPGRTPMTVLRTKGVHQGDRRGIPAFERLRERALASKPPVQSC
jgi:hypothetical protein